MAERLHLFYGAQVGIGWLGTNYTLLRLDTTRPQEEMPAGLVHCKVRESASGEIGIDDIEALKWVQM